VRIVAATERGGSLAPEALAHDDRRSSVVVAASAQVGNLVAHATLPFGKL
jgi:hypothetical protein